MSSAKSSLVAGFDLTHDRPVFAEEATPDLELRHYFGILRRRRKIILLTALLVVITALAASYLQPPIYRGTAKVLLQPRSTDALFNVSPAAQRTDPERALQTEIQVLKSEPVRDVVRARIGTAAGVSASSIGATDVIAVRAESRDPDRAAAIANAYATAYVDFRRKQAVDDLLAAGQEVQAKVVELQKQIDALEGEIASSPLSQQAAVRQAVGERKDTLVQQQGLFKQRLDQLQVDAALKSGGAQLVARAASPISPVEPQPVRNGIVGGVLGLLFGLGLGFLREFLDDSVKTKEDVEGAVRRLPVLGLIPRVRGVKRKERRGVISIITPTSSAAEAYRTLRTSIQFLGLDRPVRTLQVTSPKAQEGKTTTVANLAVAFARAGQRVVIVDCDLRRPRIEEFFSVEGSVGFTSVLLGRATVASALQPVPGESRLWILGTGPIPPNPAEVLTSRRVDQVISEIDADIVLIDSPPILPVTDALVLAPRLDATLVVCLARSTTRRDLARAVEMLRQVNAPVAGAVLNRTTAEGSYGYSYRYYGYRNGHDRTWAGRENAMLALPAPSNGDENARPPSDWTEAVRRVKEKAAEVGPHD